MSYSFLSKDLIESKTIAQETRQQVLERLAAEKDRLDAIEFEENKGNPILCLPMSEDMKYELERYNRKLKREARRGGRKRKSRFTTAAPPSPKPEMPVEETKIEEVISAAPQIEKRKWNPLLDGCRSIEEYEPLNKIDEGSYGIVFRAREKDTGKIYAIKKVKLEREKEGFPITALREIVLMMKIRHENICQVKEVVFGNSLDKVYVVLEYVDHEIKSLIQQSYDAMMLASKGEHSQSSYMLSTVEIKCIMEQLLKGVEHMHRQWIIHRDLKTSNLLISNNGILKICDFGLARMFSDPPTPYTDLVVTLWYRAPEILLGKEKYDGRAVDMWSVGCIMAELLLKEPLFMGTNELEQIDKIFKIMSIPTEETWKGWRSLKHAKLIQPGKKGSKNKLRDKFPKMALEENDMYLSDLGLDLMLKMLTYDPDKRISAKDALNHPWFKEYPKGCEPSRMPKLMATNDVPRDHSKKRRMKSLDKEQQRQREEMYENDHRFDIHQNMAYYKN
ncbi:unnamed protein product [Moneuplotes crassus]|uniref:Cyclin-dependent kinase 2 homolog n=2 Tax=Euplotes crassus TaxID=5936 RepID=A0AAD1UL59_EUPCR|nr:unnamed protein product [Moneuplotes crassus]